MQCSSPRVAGVHGALGLTRPHDGVQLIDEQDDPALGLLHLVEDSLQPLLKLAPVLGSGHQTAHIQGEDGLVLQRAGHVPLDDPLGQSLGDSGFAYAGLADEDGVILGFPGQDTDHVSDLIVPADDRVQFVLPGPLHQIGAVFLQGVVGLFRVVAGDPLVAPDVGQRLHDFLPVHVVGAEQFLQCAVGAVHQSQEDVLYGDILVLHRLGDLLRSLQSPVHILGHIDLIRLPAAAGHFGQLAHLGPDRRLKAGNGHAHGGEQLGDEALAVTDQGQQQVLLLDLLVAVLLRQTLGVLDRGKRLLCKLIHVHNG